MIGTTTIFDEALHQSPDRVDQENDGEDQSDVAQACVLGEGAITGQSGQSEGKDPEDYVNNLIRSEVVFISEPPEQCDTTPDGNDGGDYYYRPLGNSVDSIGCHR